jgi:hypothetical protein
MKVILSRKGFDSSNGGIPSPILPDGTLLSLPIPHAYGELYSKLHYEDEIHGKVSYKDIITPLFEQEKKYKFGGKIGHLDPDLDRGVFGQCGGALTHLLMPYGEIKNGVDINDIFLFYGWFRKTKGKVGDEDFGFDSDTYRHVIYGYLQIKEIIQDKTKDKDSISDEKGLKYRREEFSWHPHAYMSDTNNCLFVSHGNLIWDKCGKISEKPSFGVLDYNELCILPDGNPHLCKQWGPHSRKDVMITKQRQEHIIRSDNEKGRIEIEKWAKSIIESK